MGCRHYFVVDRLEEIVGEGGSRSSWRAHEHKNFRLVSQLHVAVQILWNRCPPRWTLWTIRLVVHSQRVSPFYLDLHLRLCLCLCPSLNAQQTNWYSCSHERNVYRFLEHSNGTCFLSQRVSPLGFGWFGWLTSACRATSEPNSFIQSCFKEIFGSCRSDLYTFSLKKSAVSIRTTFGIQ